MAKDLIFYQTLFVFLPCCVTASLENDGLKHGLKKKKNKPHSWLKKYIEGGNLTWPKIFIWDILKLRELYLSFWIWEVLE